MTKGTVYLKNDNKIDFTTEKEKYSIFVALTSSKLNNVKFLRFGNAIVNRDSIDYVTFD